MAYLRFSRDERGYEHTYVLHTYRLEGRSKPRLLYWFRTPPGVRVGRFPLDEHAIRAIEERNPDLSFDWRTMLKVRPAPPAVKRRARTKPDALRTRPKREPSSAKKRHQSTEAVGAPDVVPDIGPDEDVAAAEAVAVEARQLREEPAEPWQHPVVTLMGEQMLARLRARYAELRVRIAEKESDAETLEGASARAEALNPDRWKTVGEAVQGIERFEAEAEAIKTVLGRRPPRPRRT